MTFSNPLISTEHKQSALSIKGPEKSEPTRADPACNPAPSPPVLSLSSLSIFTQFPPNCFCVCDNVEMQTFDLPNPSSKVDFFITPGPVEPVQSGSRGLQQIIHIYRYSRHSRGKLHHPNFENESKVILFKNYINK